MRYIWKITKDGRVVEAGETGCNSPGLLRQIEIILMGEEYDDSFEHGFSIEPI